MARTGRRLAGMGSGRPALRFTAAAVVFAVLAAAVWIAAAGRDRGPQLTADQHRMIDQVESVLLHNSDRLQYARIDDPRDGRGFVAGIGDFTTTNGGILDVLQEYGQRQPGNPFTARYLPVLRTLAARADPDTRDLADFGGAWVAASDDPAFQRAQDAVMQRRYFDPAVARAQALGITSPLGVAILYDTVIEHGPGPDPDGTDALVDRTNRRANVGQGARVWLEALLELRAQTLSHPAVPQHLVTWPPTVERTQVLGTLLRAGADDLAPPLTLTAYGRNYRLGPGASGDGEVSTLAGPVPTPTVTALAAAQTPEPSASPSAAPPSARSGSPVPAPLYPATTPVTATATRTTTTAPPSQQFHFPNFNIWAALNLNGSATPSNGQIILASPSGPAGSAWWNTKIDPTRSFTTWFEFTIADVTDGMAFVIQSQSGTALGNTGGCLGYGTAPVGQPAVGPITPSVDVEFDTWSNSVDGWDPPYQHIGIMKNGDVTNHLFLGSPGFSMYGSGPVFAWLVYDAGLHTLSVYASLSSTQPASPIVVAHVDISAIVGAGPAWMGFTGGTGYIAAVESLQSWDFVAS
jgi:chitosanase